MGVPQQGRARTEVVIDEVTSRDVGDMAAMAFGDDDVHLVGQHEESEPTPGQVLAGAVEQIGLAPCTFGTGGRSRDRCHR